MPARWRELRGLGAAGLARAIAAGRVSAREAVEAHVRRIEETSSYLNAVVVPRFEEAGGEAAAADDRQARGEPLGPLHGVPITVKESFFLAGTPSTAGLPGRRGHRADADAPLVARLRRAGAIVLGKTNVPQMLLDIESDNPVYGRTRNPWDLDRSPAGSSGGEAANLAVGGAALGLGTDIGGSIRLPAHACGIHGLKPTSLRLSLAGSVDALLAPGQEAMLPQPGPLARRVEDLLLALSVLAAPGQESFDPTLPPVPLPSPGGVRIEHLRIGFYTDDGWFPASRACERAVREAASALAARGARVEEFTPPEVSEAMRVFFGLLSAAGSSWAKAFLDSGPVDPRLRERLRVSSLSPGTTRAVARALAILGQPRRARVIRALGRRSTAEYWGLVAARARYRERFFAPDGPGRFDAWLGPPAPTPALRHGASRFLFGGASYTMVSNLLGLPAGVVAATRVRPGEDEGRPRSRDPMDRAARAVDEGSAGLPVGVHVAARPWREDLVLSLMAALEEDFRTHPDYPDGPPL
jgi:fatty acid amide hydrolase